MATETQNPNVSALQSMKHFFDRTISALEESDSSFKPRNEMFTVAQQVAHTAQTIDWFMDGAFGGSGFDMDFEAHAKQVIQVKSLADAKAWFDRSVGSAIEILASKRERDLAETLPADGIMGGMPKGAVVSAITDHTAHHRGSLAVYTRLLDRVPPMPYA